MLPFLFGFFTGAAFICLMLLLWFLYPVEPKPDFSQTFTNRSMMGLANADDAAKAVNAALQFLFQELKDTGKVRRYFVKKLKEDFKEMCKSKKVNLFVRDITIREFSLGTTSPVLTDISLEDCEFESTMLLNKVIINALLRYDQGFSLSIDVKFLLDRLAQITFELYKFEARVMVGFCREPFTHWYLSFLEEPKIDLKVTSEVSSRRFPYLATVILNQLKRSLSRKHVWPAYKIRFRPFFGVPTPDADDDEREKIKFGTLAVKVCCVDRLQAQYSFNVLIGMFVSQLPLTEVVENMKDHNVTKDIIISKSVFSISFAECSILSTNVVYVSDVSPQSDVLSPGSIVISLNRMPVTSAQNAEFLLERSVPVVTFTVLASKVPDSNSQVPSLITSTKQGIPGEASDGEQDTKSLSREDSSIDVPEESIFRLTDISLYLPVDVLNKMKMTKPRRLQKFVEFGEIFTFNIEEDDKYLNACFICEINMKGKKKRGILGFTCFSLEEIAEDCVITLQRESQFNRHLIPVAKITNLSKNELAEHKGYDDSLAHGCLTVRFQTPTGDGSMGAEQKAGDTSLIESVDGATASSNAGIHVLEPIRLNTKTNCDFCQGKIWMKNALECKKCHAVCHRKCIEKCLLTSCSEAGSLKKDEKSESRYKSVAKYLTRSINTFALPQVFDTVVKNSTKRSSSLKDKTSASDTDACINDILNEINSNEEIHSKIQALGHELYSSVSKEKKRNTLKEKLQKLSEALAIECHTRDCLTMQVEALAPSPEREALTQRRSLVKEKIQSLATLYAVHNAALQEYNSRENVDSIGESLFNERLDSNRNFDGSSGDTTVGSSSDFDMNLFFVVNDVLDDLKTKVSNLVDECPPVFCERKDTVHKDSDLEHVLSSSTPLPRTSSLSVKFRSSYKDSPSNAIVEQTAATNVSTGMLTSTYQRYKEKVLKHVWRNVNERHFFSSKQPVKVTPTLSQNKTPSSESLLQPFEKFSSHRVSWDSSVSCAVYNIRDYQFMQNI